MSDIQDVILNNLIHNEPFTRKSMPHLKTEYFEGGGKVVYELILDFITKYNKLPNATSLDIEFKSSEGITRPDANEIADEIKNLDTYSKVEDEWLLESTEKWCKDRAVFNAVMESISIIDGKDEEPNMPGGLPHDHTIDTDGAHSHTLDKDDLTPYIVLAFIIKLNAAGQVP